MAEREGFEPSVGF